jgi:broad specificity phosphatase PhoE
MKGLSVAGTRVSRASHKSVTPQKWPQRLWLVRHGQSAGNVARDAAEAASLPLIDIADRDMDVPLSALGREQSRALADWFAAQPSAERPDVVLCSPYVRARQTATAVFKAVGVDPEHARYDERLREKEFGVLDRLTKFGIHERFPDLAKQRAHVGKFYFRPPGGESWCDVILRLRSVIDTLTREHAGQRVLIVAHQVIVVCMRYLLEHMDEAQVLAFDQEGDVPNCGVTSYVFDPRAGREGKLALERVNFTAPLLEAGAPVTAAPDVPAAPKP